MRLFANRPQFRFLLRACGLLTGTLLLWWIFLLDPLLGWVRISGDFVLGWVPGATEGTHISVKPDGNWMVQVPAPAEASAQAEVQRIAAGGSPAARPKKVGGFKMEIPRSRVAQFTVALPLFWVLMFAVPGKYPLRLAAYGSAGIAAAMPFALTLNTMTLVRGYFHIQSTPLAGFLWYAAGYLNGEVLPYAAPMFLGLWLNRELRAQIFTWTLPAESGPEAPLTRRERKRRRRREARVS